MNRIVVKTEAAVGVLALIIAAIALWSDRSAPELSPRTPVQVSRITPQQIAAPQRIAPQPKTPALRAAAGWPFQQLPLLAKLDLPVPRPGLVTYSRTFDLMPTPTLPEPVIPLTPDEEMPVWVLAPLAGAGFIGSVEGHDDSSIVTPEPSVLILTGTGLVILGVAAKRRRALLG